MRKLTLMAALAAATVMSSPAMAGSPDGKLQIKVLGTGDVSVALKVSANAFSNSAKEKLEAAGGSANAI